MNTNQNKLKMKFILAIMAIFLFISCKPNLQEETLNPSGFKIKRGVNLSHWLSQDFGWSPKYTYINENDIRFIDSIGYDHVRIPIDEMEMWDSTGKAIEVAFSHLSSCLDWCAKYKVRAIVDLHVIRTHHFNAVNEGGHNTLWIDTMAQQNFVNLWLQLSARLHQYPNDMVAYEILNEAVAPDHEDWNKLMNKAVSAIRNLEPSRVLIIGPNMWQIAPNIKFLKLPEGDKNIILSFHTYSPMPFTHYKAGWVPMKDYSGKVHYPGQVITNEDYTKYVDTSNTALVNMVKEARGSFDKQKLSDVFSSAVEFAKSKKLQLYCGEFGCLPTVDRQDRLQFYKDMISAFDEKQVAWCNWEYKGDFGIYYFDFEKKISLLPDKEFISVLLPSKEKH
jgi:endoglucanase